MAIDLDRDVSINGHIFKAGKAVDTKATDTVDGKQVSNDYSDGIKEVLKASNESDAAIAAADEIDPLEATKRMNGKSQPNPVTEAIAPTVSDDTNAANAGVKDKK